MRRRRQKNPMLMRIFVISILAHIVLLPILAHYGAFKKIQQHFVEVQAVRLPPPPAPEKPKQEAKKQQKAPVKVAQKAKRGPTTSHTRQAARKSSFTQPKVVASGGGPGGGEGGPTVNNDLANGKAGEIPKDETTTKPPTVKPPEPMPAKPEPPKTTEKPQEIARAEPGPVEPKPIEPKPVVPKPLEPKAPVFTEAAPAIPLDQEPKPTIPDDLRADALDKMCVVRCTVASDGTAARVEIAQSSGIDELDRAALDAARQWKFKPATRDGEPVESQVNLHIQFQVS